MTGPDDSLAAWTRALAGATATPAGGSAAAIGAALAASLVEMVAALTAARESYAAQREQASAALARAAVLRQRLMMLAREDAIAFRDVMDALALPRGTEQEIARRNAARTAALKSAAGVQYELLVLAEEVADRGEGLVAWGLRSAVGDAATAVFLSAAACRSAYWAIRSNLRRIYDDPEVERLKLEALERLERVETLQARATVRLGERV